MDDLMKDKIIAQLRIRSHKIFCKHDNIKPCDKCLKKISGDVSGIYGSASEIKGILKARVV